MAQISISRMSQDHKSESIAQTDRLPVWKIVHFIANSEDVVMGSVYILNM